MKVVLVIRRLLLEQWLDMMILPESQEIGLDLGPFAQLGRVLIEVTTFSHVPFVAKLDRR